jgi:small-conductance mechanosensitive channel
MPTPLTPQTTPPLDNLLTDLIRNSHDLNLLWQAAILLGVLLFSWFAVRLLFRRTAAWGEGWKTAERPLRQTGFPLLAIALLLPARAITEYWLGEIHLLRIAVPILLALALIQFASHVLRYTFKPGPLQLMWQRLATWGIWIAIALYLTGLLPRLITAMESVAFESGGHRFSLLLVFQALLVIIFTVVAALWIAQFVESRLMRVQHLNLSLRMALIKATRTLLLILAVLIALPAVGIDLTVLSVFGGALGVGLGFGLQKIASNYVSGFIILLDRSVRIGDMITVNATNYGQVTEINTRYTLLRALDGTETIVPNESFITQTVVNHSLTQKDIRVGLPIQVAYESDLHAAERIMLEAARNHPRVLASVGHEPRVLLKEFADSGINLELGVWIEDPEDGQLNLRSELYWAIWEAFQAENIEIPYPQRVVRVLRESAHIAGERHNS